MLPMLSSNRLGPIRRRSPIRLPAQVRSIHGEFAERGKRLAKGATARILQI